MNSLTGLSIIAVLVLGSITAFNIERMNENSNKIELAKKAREVLNFAEKSSLISESTGKEIKGIAYIPGTSADTMIIDNIPMSDRILLSKLNKAMEEAVVKRNITNPTCRDLARTGYISLNECLFIKDKKYNYVDIKNGSVVIHSVAELEDNKEKDDTKYFVKSMSILTGDNNAISLADSKEKNSKDSNNTELTSSFVISNPYIKVENQDLNVRNTLLDNSFKENFENVHQVASIINDDKIENNNTSSKEEIKNKINDFDVLKSYQPVYVPKNSVVSSTSNIVSSTDVSRNNGGFSNDSQSQGEREITISNFDRTDNNQNSRSER